MESEHESYMKIAIAMAAKGKKSDIGHSFGAVIVRNDEVVCQVHNKVKGKDDLTQHAELLAIQVACELIGKDKLKDCILYTSCEPCMMCLGASYWAKFRKIYYGASAEDARYFGFEYSNTYYNMDADLRHKEFNMVQLLRDEAITVWKEGSGADD